jgi:hypothetical protein
VGDDWYQRRRNDVEGRFWRSVARQGPRKGEGGSTQQGIYAFTADGQLLTYRNHHDPAVMREELRKALRAWERLPASRRRPGAVKVESAGKSDARYHHALPPGGLVVNVFTRILDRKGEGFCKGTGSRIGGDFAARDHLWLTEAEWKSLIPVEPKKGQTFDVPAAVRDRILRFHLVDNTRGEPPFWRRQEIRTGKMTLTVAEVTPERVRLKLEGTALLATRADPKQATRGFDAGLLGNIEYDRKKQAITRLDAVALGEHWGQGPYTGGARPGRSPLGVTFELTRGEAADSVPPQAAREIGEYLSTGR